VSMVKYCPPDPWPPESFWFEDTEDPERWCFMDTAADDPEIRAALDAAGYYSEPATEEALRSCFLDYVAAGYWRDLSLEDALADIQRGEISKETMIYTLRRG